MISSREFGYIEGTSARKLNSSLNESPRFVAYPGTRNAKKTAIQKPEEHRVSPKGIMRSILDSSEMACSLRFEDWRGCAFNAITRNQVAATSAAIFVISAFSIAIGA